MAATKKIEEFGFQAEMEQLLQLIIHSLYSHREIFLRELISNSSDALNKMRFIGLTEKDLLDEGKELRIDININEKNRSLSIKDSGLGMTKEELISNIGTIAKSGTLKFLEEMKKDPKKGDEFIGQFGVGFYSVFMVAEEVTIRTRSYAKDSVGYQWKSKGTGKFSIEEIEKSDRGTEISFTLKKDADEYAAIFRIKNIIQKYSNFVDFPIWINEEGETQKDKDKKEGPQCVNTVSAIWRKKPSEIKEEERKEFYNFISNDFGEPIGHLHIQAEAPLAYSALLFIPSSSHNTLQQKPEEFHLNLYVKRIFIQHDCKDLLPQYLRFMRGVVDSEDLPLNVSRQVTQSSSIMAKMKKALTNRLMKLFEEWLEKDREKYEKFFKEFGGTLKEGIHFDFENKDRLTDLVLFHSTKSENGKKVKLSEYVDRMKTDQKYIFYLAGESLDALKKNPNLEYFQKNEIEVLLLDENIDDFIMPIINSYRKKDIKSIEKADLDIADKKVITPEGVDGSTRVGFMDKVKEILGDRVKDVAESKRLVESPCTLVIPADAMNTHMEKMMKMMDSNFAASKKIMEINLNNPIVLNLIKIFKANANDINLADGVMALYDGALLLDGNLKDVTSFMKRVHQFMEKATGTRIIT